jgi:hypothetical protein
MMRSLPLGLLGLSLVACNGGSSGEPTQRPIDSTAATAMMSQRVDDLIRGLADSSAQLDTRGGTQAASGSLDVVLGSSPSCTTTGSTTDTGDDVSASTGKAIDELLHKVAQEAKDHVFRDEFVELDDGNQVIYKIDPTAACGTDATCVDQLTRNPLRFSVTANTDDSLNVALLVGEARYNPGTALISSSKLSVRGDLARSLDAIRLFVKDADQGELPERLQGVVEGSIEKRAEGDFAISSSIVETFDLLVGQGKGKPVAVTVQPSTPTTMLTVNANTNTLGYALSLGAVDVHVAGAAVCNDQCGSKEKAGTFAAHLGGLTGSVGVTQGAQELTFSGLGLGNDTSQVTLDGSALGTLDLNEGNGRRVSVTFAKATGGTLITLDPALDIKLALMLNKLSDSLRVDLPDWLSDEIFDVMLGGAPKPSVLVPAAGCDANGNRVTKSQLQVATGTLTLAATSVASPVTASAGMCLLPVDGADSGAHPFSRVMAGTCQ